MFDRIKKLLIQPLLITIVAVVMAPMCVPAKSGNVESICQNALIKQAVVIAAATARSIPIERYVDELCKIGPIVEPFIIDQLKGDPPKGTVGAPDPIAQSLGAARERGLVE